MRTLLSILVFCLAFSKINAQDFSANRSDSDTTVAVEKAIQNRVKLVAAGSLAAYGGTTIALYSTWYKNYPQSSFHFFNDNKEWLQVDKAGHTWSSYSEGRAGIALWRWTGLPRKKVIWIGGLSGLTYQSIIEVMDGFSSEWGFSWGDYAANVIGTGLLIGQELRWNEQRIQLKFSAHPKKYDDYFLKNRATNIYGSNLPERLLKDYNAQTYWLSTNIRSIFKDSNFPSWLNIAVGYGAGGMFGAADNKWTDENGTKYDRTDIKRYRQYYIAPDVDFTKLHTKSEWLKATFFILNSFKFPSPSLEFSNNKVKVNWLHF